MSDAKQDWERMLRFMLVDFRKNNPQDPRSDREILTSLMEYFVESGTIKKTKEGKYIIGDIVDIDSPSIN